MNRKILILFISLGIWNNLCAQKSSIELEIYKNFEKHYSIKYPENWKIENNEEGVISIESDKMIGGIYISAYDGITFSDERMNDFILDSNNLPDDFRKNILSGEENGIKSWYISYTDTTNNLTCMSMYKRMNAKLWFVSTEIEPDLWKKGWQNIIVNILISFEII